jgi:Zn-dependent protease with chaperone function
MSWRLIPRFVHREEPIPNAYTYGYINPFVVVATVLIKDFSKEEFMFILGHEL